MLEVILGVCATAIAMCSKVPPLWRNVDLYRREHNLGICCFSCKYIYTYIFFLNIKVQHSIYIFIVNYYLYWRDISLQQEGTQLKSLLYLSISIYLSIYHLYRREHNFNLTCICLYLSTYLSITFTGGNTISRYPSLRRVSRKTSL